MFDKENFQIVMNLINQKKIKGTQILFVSKLLDHVKYCGSKGKTASLSYVSKRTENEFSSYWSEAVRILIRENILTGDTFNVSFSKVIPKFDTQVVSEPISTEKQSKPKKRNNNKNKNNNNNEASAFDMLMKDCYEDLLEEDKKIEFEIKRFGKFRERV